MIGRRTEQSLTQNAAISGKADWVSKGSKFKQFDLLVDFVRC